MNWADFERRVLTVTNAEHFTTKSKRVRVVPLVDDARTVLLSLDERSTTRLVKAKDSGLVFTRNGGAMEEQGVSKGFKIAEGAGDFLARFTFTACHTVASWLVQAAYRFTRLQSSSDIPAER